MGLLLLAAGVRGRPAEEGWTALFNGRDLEGWTAKIAGHDLGENYADTFRVENGLLVVSYDGYEEFGGRFGHLFADGVHESYRLRVEYRFVGEQARGGPAWALRNSGVMIHGQPPETMTRDQAFPVSIEVQLLGGLANVDRNTANLCTPGTLVMIRGELITRHCTDSSAPAAPGDAWVTVVIEVRGAEIRHQVEGSNVLAYDSPQLDPDDADARRLLAAGAEARLLRGSISIQAESHPVQFRRLEIQPLRSAG